MGGFNVASSVSHGDVKVVGELLELLTCNRVVDNLCFVEAGTVTDVDYGVQRFCVNFSVIRVGEVGDVVVDAPLGDLLVDTCVVRLGACVPAI